MFSLQVRIAVVAIELWSNPNLEIFGQTKFLVKPKMEFIAGCGDNFAYCLRRAVSLA